MFQDIAKRIDQLLLKEVQVCFLSGNKGCC